VLSVAEARELVLHVGSAACRALVGDVAVARTESVLAWAVLGTVSPAAVETPDLDALPSCEEVLPGHDGEVLAGYRDARDAAYAFMGHFVSEQRPDVVAVYERAVAVLDRAIARLERAPTGGSS